MSGKKEFKALEKRLTRLGFEYDHQNASSQFVYVHDAHPDLAVSPGISEGAGRILLRKVEKSLGCLEAKPKRNAQAVKERQATERERQQAELTRLDAERAEILRRRDDLLGGAGAHLSNAEIRAIEDRVRAIEAERRAIERLMNAPTTASDRGRRSARHEAGGAA